MAYLDEEEVWKCTTHPAKRRNPYGVCPRCLRDKLSSLCPDCASTLPCSCSSSSDSSTSSSSSSSSSSSRFFSSRSSTAGKVTRLVDSDPSFRRSRSVATLNLPSFLSSRSKFSGRDSNPPPPPKTGSSFWGKFRRDRSKRGGHGYRNMDEDASTMMGKVSFCRSQGRDGGSGVPISYQVLIH